MIDHDVAGDPQQPVLERQVAPLEAVDALPRLGEHLSGQVLGDGPVTHLVQDITVNRVQVTVVQEGERLGVTLRCAPCNIPGVGLRPFSRALSPFSDSPRSSKRIGGG